MVQYEIADGRTIPAVEAVVAPTLLDPSVPDLVQGKRQIVISEGEERSPHLWVLKRFSTVPWIRLW